MTARAVAIAFVVMALLVAGCPGLTVVNPKTRSDPRWEILKAPGAVPPPPQQSPPAAAPEGKNPP